MHSRILVLVLCDYVGEALQMFVSCEISVHGVIFCLHGKGLAKFSCSIDESFVWSWLSGY